MAKNFAKILLILLLVFLAGCVKNSDSIYIGSGKKLIKVNVEIADDNEERMKGLMFRQSLDYKEGTLFIFENEDYHTFWMKNTLIPLDMIFIDKNLEIVDIKNAVPCETEPCLIYKPSKPAKYVLEVNANFASENEIGIGDKLVLDDKPN